MWYPGCHEQLILFKFFVQTTTAAITATMYTIIMFNNKTTTKQPKKLKIKNFKQKASDDERE